jgi:SAM-dependent methyltransferase
MTNKAWDDFWKSDEAAAGCGALATQWHAIEAAQGPFWQAFARTLPKGGRVLDLATGNGVVMGWLVSARRDLKPVGIDLAPTLPTPPKGCRSVGGVAMEAVPFKDATYDAVVSRFGVEYGDVPRVVAEIARVVRPGGKVGLITHKFDGAIMEHNRRRREGLQWALHDKAVIGSARAGLALRRIGLAVPPAIAAAPAEARARFGAQSSAWEICEAVVQTLTLGRNADDAHLLETLLTLENKARNEIGRIDSLESACERIKDADALEARFASHGLRLADRKQLHVAPGEPPFADAWTLQREGE